MKKVTLTNSPEETVALAAEVARSLKAGDAIGLIGELGAGKTCFVRGIADGLGVKCYVKSPSFTIINIYEGGRLPLYHIDLYRLSSASELRETGLEDYIYGNGISVIEWVDRAPELAAQCCLVVRLGCKGEGVREVELEYMQQSCSSVP
ncbi:MAG: tRNA (adenosine(37)-N6)-threonylcarbamoyltransferase complex ATPase subunit type 1 TsaE [Deltaproteobacteria bacterium RIFCSPLOWO2_02_FULL_53_8]|nr:MAG: tRNA (adenosine(37)-N6)-threonylcarbamoyltransferase complex ATPase subunit type 1 TsaE [Deltaproteobacteria bacterium RIFCSPLOWO2_02_FULL_53_8]